MRKTVIVLILFVCVVMASAGTALADAPTAMSYFTNPEYNKTFTADDGLEHTMTVKWVGETWNKIGTVIYSINYEETYQNGNDYYIDVKSAMEYYENARPTYPDSTEYSVYQVKWYPDGNTEVVSDYRPASTPTPDPTLSPAPTVIPTATSTAAPTSVPTSVPTPAATAVPTSIPTSVPTNEATPKPTVSPVVEGTDANTAIPATPVLTETPTVVPGSSSNTKRVTAFGPSPAVTVISVTPVGTYVSTYEELESDGELASLDFPWFIFVLVLLEIGIILLLAFILRAKRREEGHGDEDHSS